MFERLGSRLPPSLLSSPSCIHSHANSHCFMKILAGSLKETQFAWPSECEGQLQPMQQQACHSYYTDEVTYINGGWLGYYSS